VIESDVRSGWKSDALRVLRDPLILRRSAVVALVVGTILSVVNQWGVVTSGNATAATWARIATNYLTPFVVSSVGAFSALRASTPAPGGEAEQGHH
jgi:hypothetical protein